MSRGLTNPGSYTGRLGWRFGCLQLLFALVAFTLPLPQAATAQDFTDLTDTVEIRVDAPVRSRRSPNATVNVFVTNTTSDPLAAPSQLVITGLTSSVSIDNADGTSASGDPVFDLDSRAGGDIAPGQTVGPIGLSVVGGGRNAFTFIPRVEGVVVQFVPLAVQITDPSTLTTVGVSPLQVSGTVTDDAAEVTLNGVSVPVTAGSFQASVALQEGLNNIVARALRAGTEETTDSIAVSLDQTPPFITIESHQDGQKVTTDTINVTGQVNDIVRGTISADEAVVIVNGVDATVSNRTYAARDVPLIPGLNVIAVTGADAVGNVGRAEITVEYVIPQANKIELSAGQGQRARIFAELDDPLVVRLTDGLGAPVPDKNVVFRVIQGDGAVGIGTGAEAQAALAVTNALGVASTRFRLGGRAGEANQRVRATSVGFEGQVVFDASADPNPGDKISVISGNNQRGGIRQPLPNPLVVAVTDEGSNLIPGAEVEFRVTRGGGLFGNGAASIRVLTDRDGRASAELTLGEEAGNGAHRATATLLGTTASAGFVATAFVPGNPGNTSISGVVLDNQDAPIPGVTVRIEGTTRETTTDANGQFRVLQAPVGPVHLLVDGSTATIPGEYPTLPVDIVTVAGVDNPLSAPVYMVKLNTANARTVGAEDVEFTLPEVPGFKLFVKAGSVTFPDGASTGQLSVTPVNANKIPMAPPNGMQPQLIVTIQPAGTRFDPPAPLTLPNVDAHPPGAQVEMYSFDHDLDEFVTIGLGTVNAAGTLIESNAGVGVIKAGWHCGSQPSGSGCTHNCPACEVCDDECNCRRASAPTLTITSPQSAQTFLVRRKFSETALQDEINLRANTTPNSENTRNAISWFGQGVGSGSGSIALKSPDNRGAHVVVVPKPPAHPTYAKANGSKFKSTPFQYRIEARSCGVSRHVTIIQDEIDILRQEYLNHGQPAPARTAFGAPKETTNFNKNEINITPYSVVVTGAGPFAQKVRDAYNKLIFDDEQLVPVGDVTASATTRVVGPGATIETIGAILDATPNNTAACNGTIAPEDACDDIFDSTGKFILAGPNRIVESVAVKQTTNFGLKLNSGWRNPERNEAVGGVIDSRHQFGGAVDLAITSLHAGKTKAQLYCILVTAADSISNANGFAEKGPVQVACNHADVSHVHVQTPP